MYPNPYYPQLPLQFPQQMSPVPPRMEIQKVSGEDSAKAFPIGPDSSAILMDLNDPLIWVITTDASGFKNVTPFSISPYVKEEPVKASDITAQIDELNNRLNKLEERMTILNGKPNKGVAWKGKPSDSNDRYDPVGQRSNANIKPDIYCELISPGKL